MRQHYKSGDYNAVCDICGGKFKASSMLKTWDGFYTFRHDWYPRNPLDFPVKIKEDPTPEWTRPYGEALDTGGDELVLTGIIQFYNGVANSPSIPNILNTSTVTYSANYIDGPQGEYALTIQPKIGFYITTTQQMELSTLKYSVTI